MIEMSICFVHSLYVQSHSKHSIHDRRISFSPHFTQIPNKSRPTLISKNNHSNDSRLSSTLAPVWNKSQLQSLLRILSQSNIPKIWIASGSLISVITQRNLYSIQRIDSILIHSLSKHLFRIHVDMKILVVDSLDFPVEEKCSHRTEIYELEVLDSCVFLHQLQKTVNQNQEEIHYERDLNENPIPVKIQEMQSGSSYLISMMKRNNEFTYELDLWIPVYGVNDDNDGEYKEWRGSVAGIGSLEIVQGQIQPCLYDILIQAASVSSIRNQTVMPRVTKHFQSQSENTDSDGTQ